MSEKGNGSPISRAASLAGLVAYQPGSVVSRVLLRNEGGVITLFAFADGEGLTEHSSPNEAVVFVLEGEVRITVGDDEHLVTQGDMLHLPAGVPHALLEGGPFKMLLTQLRGTGGR